MIFHFCAVGATPFNRLKGSTYGAIYFYQTYYYKQVAPMGH